MSIINWGKHIPEETQARLSTILSNTSNLCEVLGNGLNRLEPESRTRLADVISSMQMDYERMLAEAKRKAFKVEPHKHLPKQTVKAALARNDIMKILNESVEKGDREMTVHYARELAYLEEHANEY